MLVSPIVSAAPRIVSFEENPNTAKAKNDPVKMLQMWKEDA
jgi:hypothetical protein